MSTVNPKWIQYDDTIFTSVDIDGVSNLTLRSDTTLPGVGVEYINGSKIIVSNIEPTGTITQNDIWIEKP